MVAAATNDPPPIAITAYPAKFGDPDDMYGGLPNMIVVAASDWMTERSARSRYSPWVTTFAPGRNVHCPAEEVWDDQSPMRACTGTSFGT